MTRFITILAVLLSTSIAYALPGAGLLHKITGGHSSQQNQQNQQNPGQPGNPPKKKGFFGKIKSGVSHAISAPQCTQSVCSDPYQFTPQKANYCLGTEGKARTNINCSKVFLNGPLAQNPAYAQVEHYAQIAMQKGGSGLGKLSSAVSGVHAIATCTAQKCGNPNMGRNEIFSCLGTVSKVQRNPNCANAYYQAHCLKLQYPQYGAPMPMNLPHGVEFCNTINQSRGQMPLHPGMVHPGMMGAAGCHGSITYTTQGGMPGGMNQSSYGNNSYGGRGGITAVNPYDRDGDPNTDY